MLAQQIRQRWYSSSAWTCRLWTWWLQLFKIVSYFSVKLSFNFSLHLISIWVSYSRLQSLALNFKENRSLDWNNFIRRLFSHLKRAIKKFSLLQNGLSFILTDFVMRIIDERVWVSATGGYWKSHQPQYLKMKQCKFRSSITYVLKNAWKCEPFAKVKHEKNFRSGRMTCILQELFVVIYMNSDISTTL